jgi:CRISPR/Cas system type I-B associated protein Csh2 (Cas7 group RAMP superfamily)
VGVGLSVARVEIDRMTQTNKAGVEGSKDRGMAPLGDRRVRHGVYSIPFFVNPTIAIRTGMTHRDLNLLRFLLPYSYVHTASAIRPFVSVLHAWWIEHKNPLGSCPDTLLIDALTPRRKGGGLDPSTSLDDYDPIPNALREDLGNRVKTIEDVAAPVPA